MRRIIVAGGREFDDFELLRKTLDEYLDGEIVEIISGGAKGADYLGERYAKEKKLELKIFPANWKLFGKQAGPIRNRQMAEYGTEVIVFWNGVSRGSKSMIGIAEEKGLSCKIIKYDSK